MLLRLPFARVPLGIRLIGLLVAEGGRLAGVIALKDIMGYISLKLDLEER